MDPLFQIDDEVGLEAPPVEELGPGQALGAPAPAPAAAPAVIVICPNCGCQDCGSQDPAGQQVDQAGAVTCPVCQSEFEAPRQQAGAELALPMESSVHRILGRVFERHVRRHAYALKRVAGRTKLPKQPELPGNAS